jgi:hypothetical protein
VTQKETTSSYQEWCAAVGYRESPGQESGKGRRHKVLPGDFNSDDATDSEETRGPVEPGQIENRQ